MSLTLHSTFPELDQHMRAFDGDDNVGAAEFQQLRDDADRHLDAIATVDASGFREAADGLAEAMQKLALAARKAKLSPEDRTALKTAAEYQMAYVVAGYQSSLQRL
ncbi:hypothetical protein [Luteibacter sp. UNCMF366Tsu5.1]|uniref:hypothetical protein n=1 Tax=Luteibacter sp. UNCMF366Tsu5.1 TaxID=1502758 RepID=UPI000908A893|nr:hypothetical protein [Luteibacter sp. UNCMF366Tsu5.1]SFW57729.1 hypothetical protein SAMN02800691_2274 [Luteibacter sp. UNCMF366Tsu5.1]